MRLDKLTIKAQEALEAAQGIADAAGSATVDPEHLLKALLDQADGIVRPIVAKVGADPTALDTDIKDAIARAPKVIGAVLQVGPRLNTVLNDAFKAAEKMKDAYVSTEHLLLALAVDKGEAGRVLDVRG
jgi:ATP-dependent Clp protease ATP-binding subunit ClpB